jgi:hypothetical protein
MRASISFFAAAVDDGGVVLGDLTFLALPSMSR